MSETPTVTPIDIDADGVYRLTGGSTLVLKFKLEMLKDFEGVVEISMQELWNALEAEIQRQAARNEPKH